VIPLDEDALRCNCQYSHLRRGRRHLRWGRTGPSHVWSTRGRWLIELLRLGSNVFRLKPGILDGVLIVSPLFRRCVIFACIFKLFISCWLQSSILRNLFAFKCLVKKERGGWGTYFGGYRPTHPWRVEGIEDLWCFDGHESIVRVSAN
jgi:hypothetical protein